MHVKTSSNFKKQVQKTIFSIVWFVIVYLILFLLAIALAAGCAFIGFKVLTFAINFFTIVIGLGLISVGFFVLFFLIKFLFTSTKTDSSHLVEISEEQEPELFHLIHEIVNEVETDFPKKVYLSDDINASVFYDSSFWSMFLPIRKNLQIGVGLINSVTHQELKAILAHEFGHFSQRSMKVGSYVYNVNQIIYNMLYNNSTMANMMESFSNISGYFVFFVRIAVFLIEGIQFVLRKMYDYVNINYMSLSREMEFHADEIAANVAGSAALSNSLLRLNFANYTFNQVLGFYSRKIHSCLTTENIYRDHHCVNTLLAERYKYPTQNGFAIINLEHISKYNKSKLNIKNQWASHPSDEERIAALNKLNIVKTNTNDLAAIHILNTDHNISKQFSEKIFSQTTYVEAPTALSLEDFKIDFYNELNENSFDKIFNEYYDFNNPIVKDLSKDITPDKSLSLDDIFSEERSAVFHELTALKEDKQIVQSIISKELKIKSFDYDGVKYKSKNAASLLQILDQEIALKEELIEKYNDEVFHFFLNKAVNQGKDQELKELYADFQNLNSLYNERLNFHTEFYQKIGFLFQVVQFDQIEINFIDIKGKEDQLKDDLKNLIADSSITHILDSDVLKSIQKYTTEDLIYFANNEYINDHVTILMTAVENYMTLVGRDYFNRKKALLDFKKTLIVQ